MGLARLRSDSAERLHASEERYRGIAERSFDMIFLTDTAGKILYVSPAVEKIVGCGPERVVGRHFQEFVAEHDLPRVLESFARRVHGQDMGTVGFEIRRADGRSAFVELNSALVVADGELVGVQGIIRDVTQRRQDDEKLRRLEEQLAHLARLSTMGEMVAGIAHELSQPLYTIQNIAQACQHVLANPAFQSPGDLPQWCVQIAEAASSPGRLSGSCADSRDVRRPASRRCRSIRSWKRR